MSETNTEKKDTGAVWVRLTKANDKFLSMKLNLKPFGLDKEVELVAWKNRNKEAGDKRPDFHIFPSEPRPANYTPKPKTAAPAPVAAAPADSELI